MTVDVELVAHSSVLDSLSMSQKDKYASFLRYWLTERQTKAIVSLKAWNVFKKKWDGALADCSDEIKKPFFAFMRGVATPYRDKYLDEDAEGTDVRDNEIEEITRIGERHYATVKYIVVDVPPNFHGKTPKVPSEVYLTLKEFYTLIETQDNAFVLNFCKLWEAENPPAT